MRVKRLDAHSIRVLAHPLRVRIVGSLRTDGPATATVLAERLGASSGLTSYHVRVLAEAGFVEEDADHETRGRQRWWRAAHDMTSWRSADAGEDPEAAAAEQWLSGFTARTSFDHLDDWLRRRPTADPAWVEVSDTSDYFFDITADELRSMLDEVHTVLTSRLEQWRRRDPPPGAARVELVLAAFPR